MRFFGLFLIVVLVGCGGSDSNQGSHLFPYQTTSAYSANLVDCSQAYRNNKSCYINALPPLNLTSSSVTVEQIMSRVVVSHSWMGVRFEEILRGSPQELLDLFAPITAIVISDDIRPAFYHPLTGAIYLDPIYLWTNEAEFNTIDLTPDYRDGFGDELQFVRVWRYLDSNNNLIPLYEDEYGGNRSISTIKSSMIWLLFHELAHANDHLPPNVRTQINASNDEQAFYELIEENLTQQHAVQSQLVSTYPLTSQMMNALAKVLFGGETATSQQKSFSGAEVGAEFVTDTASDAYAYRSDAEDLAMLFEEVLMAYSLGTKRDLAFLKRVKNGSCNDHTIEWGQRGRIGHSAVKERAKFVVSRLLPAQATSINAYLNQLNEPESLPLGKGWCESRQPAQGRVPLRSIPSASLKEEKQFHYFKQHRMH